MDVRIDGESYDIDDPRKRAEAIRRWLRKKAEENTFRLPELPDEQRKGRGETPARPFAPVKG